MNATEYFTYVCIPLYVCLLRPILFHYVPGMLKRIGLGVVALVLSLISTFVKDTVAHAQERNKVVCMLDSPNNNSLDSFSDASVLVVQQCLASFSNIKSFDWSLFCLKRSLRHALISCNPSVFQCTQSCLS